MTPKSIEDGDQDPQSLLADSPTDNETEERLIENTEEENDDSMSPKSIDGGDQDHESSPSDSPAENEAEEQLIENTEEENDDSTSNQCDEEIPVPAKTVFVPASSFLPQAIDEEDGDSDSDGAFFIDDGEVGDLPTRSSLPSSDEGLNLDSKRASSSSSTPTRSILKAAVEEDIPVCTKKSSWSKLPVPNMERVKLKRAESLGSFFHLQHFSDTSSVRSDKSNSKVNFQDITIREYYQTIGDNPAVSYGAPIQLDWDYEEQEPLDLDLYEAYRGQRRTNKEMHLNYLQRQSLLVHKFGYTMKEVKDAHRECRKIHGQRKFSKSMQTKFRPLLKLEEMRESAVRKVARTVGRPSRSCSIDETSQTATLVRSMSNLEFIRPTRRSSACS